MPWYKTGTVKTTINSNAIIGTGTAFISNSRVGDAFRGPDGNWYEVVNIASDTAMSISPNYQGPTVAAGAYSIAPMQGYVKESADALRGITNTYGTKLLALGTTGNYDVLPVAKGGTGGTTQAAARTGLGLGTSATLSVTTTEERALPGSMGGKVADAGFRGISGFLDLRGSIFETGTPTALSNTGFVTGFVQLSTMGITGSILPGAAYGHLTVVTPLNGKSGVVGQTTIRTVRSGQYETVSYATSDTTWSAWSEPNVRGGANSTITSLSGLTTALSIAQGGTGGNTAALARDGLGLKAASLADILGGVTQSGGVPTGAIFQKGSSANGDFTLFASGLGICTYLQASVVATANTDMTFTWSFPAVFSKVPFAGAWVRGGNANDTFTLNRLTVAPTSGSSATIVGNFSVGQTYYISLVAIGNWFA